MDEITRDVSGDAASDITWMTYAELGQARGISAASAKRLAIRRHWRRQQGNDGTARVAVPVTEATRREDKAGDATSDDAGDVTRAITALETAVTALRDQLEQANERADRAEQGREGERARADALRDRVDDLSAKLTDAQAELAAAQDQAEAGRRQLEATQIALGEAEADAAELRQTDTQRKGRGRWARLRVAWRGE
jgi:chromosome segregation ATPase